MYNLLLAFGVGAAFFVVGALVFGPFAGILPGLLAFGIAQFLLGRRTAAAVQREIAGLEPLLRERKIDEAVALLVGMKERYAKWHFLLAAQVDAQLGTLDYLQMKFDEARPKLESGGRGPFAFTAFGRNALALALLGCIHWRQGRKEEAWKAFQAAGEAAQTDVIVFQVWATLLVRDGKRAEALQAVATGLKAHPNSQPLVELQSKIANDKKVDTKAFGQAWFQFFPEDLMKEAMMGGRRGPTPIGAPTRPQAPRIGARHAPRR